MAELEPEPERCPATDNSNFAEVNNKLQLVCQHLLVFADIPGMYTMRSLEIPRKTQCF